MNKDLKVVFMGTPDFSLNILEGLIENYKVVLVVSQPDKEVGRHKEIRKTPVKVLAEENNIEVFQPVNIKEDYQRIIDVNPDIIVTCAYGQIIPKKLLDYPKYGCINVHASLLPKLRGGAPIHHAIIDGYEKTGITIMYMDVKMDSGDIISQRETVIDESDTVETLHDRLSLMGKELLIKTIPDIINGNIKRVSQNPDEVTYAWNIKREEEHVNFNDTIINVYNKIRGLNPFPGSYAILDKKIVKFYASHISDKKITGKINGEISSIYNDSFGINVDGQELVIEEIQIEGKKKMKVKDYFNGIDKNSLLGKVFE